MAVYCVTGNLGSGKSLVCVGRIYEALKAGKRVATNFNLRMEHLSMGKAPTVCYRIPDVPGLADFVALGKGSEQCELAREGEHFDESSNGIIVLDEIMSMLDARSWQDKGRAELLEWLKHSRKYGWDLYFIVQHESTLDSQARKMLLEHLVICKRLDRVRIPLLGTLLRLIGFTGRFLKLHLATVRYGQSSVHSTVSDRWITWGRRFLWMGLDLHFAYDTRQIFRRDNPTGMFQYLDLYRAPWLKPRFNRWDLLADRCELSRFTLVRKLGDLLPRSERGAWFDCWLAERFGVPRYKPSVVTFEEFAESARHALDSGELSDLAQFVAGDDAAQPQLEAA